MRDEIWKKEGMRGALFDKLSNATSVKHLKLETLNLNLVSELLGSGERRFVANVRPLIKSLQVLFSKQSPSEDFKTYLGCCPSHNGVPFHMEAVRHHSHSAIMACLELEDIVVLDWSLTDKNRNNVFHLLLSNPALSHKERSNLIELFLEKAFSLATALNLQGYSPFTLALTKDAHECLKQVENFQSYRDDVLLHNTVVYQYFSSPAQKLWDVSLHVSPLEICVRRGKVELFKELVLKHGCDVDWICLNRKHLLTLAIEYLEQEIALFILDHTKGYT